MNPGVVVELPLYLIDDTDRLRPVDAAYAVLIAESVEERGLDTPIQVTAADRDGHHRLIAGAHRLAAFRLLEREKIPALVVTVDELHARLIEIDENLMRRELNALERGAFLAERKRVHQELTGRFQGGDRKSKQYQAQNQKDKLAAFSRRFTDEIAERCGLSGREIRRSIARFTGLAEDVRTRLVGTWMADNGIALDALRKLPPDQQRAVLDDLDARGGEDLAGAIRRATGREMPAPPDDYEKFVGLWRRMDRRTRERVRRFINLKTSLEGSE